GYRPLSKTSASKLGSKVWNYFQPLEHIAIGNRVGWCPLEVIRNRQKQTCNTICNIGESTGNMWDHLSSIHGITKNSNLKSKDQQKIITIAQSNDLQTQKESKCLQQIMLTDSEWNVIKELVIILCPFAEASTYLGASKSSMIRFINPTLSYIKQDLYNENSILYDLPDLENSDMAFDNEIDEDNEFVILHNHKLNINIPQDCDNLEKK
ncbi:22170_t:CDS:2, partial [Racocetra persica]